MTSLEHSIRSQLHQLSLRTAKAPKPIRRGPETEAPDSKCTDTSVTDIIECPPGADRFQRSTSVRARA